MESISRSSYRSTAACSMQRFERAFCESIDTTIVDSRRQLIEQLSDTGGFEAEIDAVLFRI